MAIADFVVKHGATVNEVATFNSTTDAASTTSAALTVAGGVGIAKKLIVGSTISTTQLTSTATNGTAPFVVASTTAVTNLKADTVVTNANLTGVITSVGNATSIASQTGTGTKFVVDTSPTLVTPNIGAATATSINGLTISTSTGALTVANGKTLTVNNTLTFSGTDSTSFTLPSTSGTLALNNQTHYIGTTSIAINRSSASQTLTGVSIDGNAATVTTNANLTGVITSVGNTTSIASQTGTGTKFVVDTSPTLITPNIGVATATSINSLTISTSTGILTIANGKTLTFNNTLTLSGTDNAVLSCGSGGTVAYTTVHKLSNFQPTTSGELASVISDETGSGALVFGTSPAITTSLTTPSTAFDLINTTATSVNFAKAATAISIGATTGTTTINHSVVVTGDLTVNGTTTTVNSTTVTVDDKNIELGSVTTPTDATAASGGITLKGATDKTILWASTGGTGSTNTGYWNISENVNASGASLGYYINNVSVLSSSAILGSATTIGVGSSSSTITLNGTIKLPNVGTSGFVKLGTGGQLSSDTNTYALTNQTMYLGTTSVTINRSSGAMSLAGVSIDGNAGGLSSTLGVASGGTGATSLTANNVLLGNGTSAVQVVAPGTSGNILTSNGSTWTSAAPPTEIPSQSGNSGKYLTTNGTTTSWETVYQETVVSITGASTTIDVDFNLATNKYNTFYITIFNASSATINFKNLNTVSSSSKMFSFNVILKNNATALSSISAITWQFAAATTLVSTVSWAGGSSNRPPSTTAANAIDVWSFFTVDGGATLIGSLAMKDVKSA